MKCKVTKKVIFIIIGLFLFLINNNVYANPKAYNGDKLICTYDGGNLKIYYNAEANEYRPVNGERLGTATSPFIRNSAEPYKIYDTETPWQTGVTYLKENWKMTDAQGNIKCPDIYYKKDCKYQSGIWERFWGKYTGYGCNWAFSPTERKGFSKLSPDSTLHEVDEYSCLYDDVLLIGYDKEKGYAFYKDTSSNAYTQAGSGTADDPYRRLDTIKELNKKAVANNELKVGKFGYWNFLDENGKFVCPVIYSKVRQVIGANGNYYNYYSYSPTPWGTEGTDDYIGTKTQSSRNGAKEQEIPVNELPICKSNIVSYFTDKDENGKEIKSPQIKINGFDDVVVTLDDGTTDSFADILTDLEKFFNEKRTFFSNGLSETAYNYYFGEGTLGLTAKINGETAHFYTRLRKLIKSIDCQMTDEMINQKTYELDRKINNFANDLKATLLAGIDKSVENGNISEEKAEELRNKTDEVVENFKNNVERFTDVIGSWYGKLMGIEKQTCESILDKDLVTIINRILTWIRIAVPILVIILSSMDFGKAVLSEEKDEMKQAINKLVKRLVVAIIIFFIPTLLHLFVDIYNTTVGSDGIPITPLSNCGIK